MKSSYDSISGIYSYKKDGQWFFSVCPPDQVASKRVDGKWYFIELCVGGGGGDSDVSKIYVDSQDQKLQANIDKCFADSKDYADSIVADYALVSYVDEQIAAIEIPEGQDLSLYAKTTDMTAGDAATLKDSKSYTDEQIGGLDISVDLSDYASQEWVLDQGYITDQPVTDGDAATLDAANKYTDEQIAAIEFPEGVDLSAYAETTYVDGADQAVQRFAVSADEAVLNAAKSDASSNYLSIKEGGTVEGAVDLKSGLSLTGGGGNQFIKAAEGVTGQLVYEYEGASEEEMLRLAWGSRYVYIWVPLDMKENQIVNLKDPNPNDIQSAVTVNYLNEAIGSIDVGSSDVDKAYVDTQDATKIGNAGEQILPTSSWKLRARKADDSGAYSYISIQDDSLKLYHVADPTADAHGMSRGYADSRYQFLQRQIVFKCDQYVKCSTNPNPAPGEFCGLNNSSPGSSTSPNPYFGNWNVGVRVDAGKLLNPEGNQFSDMERYTFEGTVTILDNNGKLYFKGNVHSVSRTNNNSYVDINFGSRIPAFGTGAYNDSEKYIILVEGLETIQPATTNIPEE